MPDLTNFYCKYSADFLGKQTNKLKKSTMRVEKAEKVTREQLRNLAAGESIALVLPSGAAVESAKNTAYQFQKVIGARFECKAGEGNKLIITRYDDYPARS